MQSRFGLRVRVKRLDPFTAGVPNVSVYLQFCLLVLVWLTMDSDSGLSVTSVPLHPPARSVRYIPTSGMLVTQQSTYVTNTWQQVAVYHPTACICKQD